jgi:hypothetical protein
MTRCPGGAEFRVAGQVVGRKRIADFGAAITALGQTAVRQQPPARARMTLQFDELRVVGELFLGERWRFYGLGEVVTFGSSGNRWWLRDYLDDAEHDLRLLQQGVDSAPDTPGDGDRVRALLELARLHLVFDEVDAATEVAERAGRLRLGGPAVGVDADRGRELAELFEEFERTDAAMTLRATLKI